VKRILYLCLTLAACSNGKPETAILSLAVTYDPTSDRCVFKAGDEVIQVDTEAGLQRVADLPKKWPGQDVSIVGTTAAPYKCVGAAIFTLQRAGKRVGFIAAPPPPTQ